MTNDQESQLSTRAGSFSSQKSTACCRGGREQQAASVGDPVTLVLGLCRCGSALKLLVEQPARDGHLAHTEIATHDSSEASCDVCRFQVPRDGVPAVDRVPSDRGFAFHARMSTQTADRQTPSQAPRGRRTRLSGLHTAHMNGGTTRARQRDASDSWPSGQ